MFDFRFAPASRSVMIGGMDGRHMPGILRIPLLALFLSACAGCARSDDKPTQVESALTQADDNHAQIDDTPADTSITHRDVLTPRAEDVRSSPQANAPALIDEAKAIAIAKKAISHFGNPNDKNIIARRKGDEWLVLVWWEPERVGNYRMVSISPAGKVTHILGGK